MYEQNPGQWQVTIPDVKSVLTLTVDIENYKEACEWAADRHSIWYQKEVLKSPRPWTMDPILDKWKFINVYRKLDAGTKYILEYFDTNPDPLSRFANILRYRLFNNRHAHKATGGFHKYHEFDYDKWYKILRDRWASEERVLCQAHNTCTYSGFPGSDKVERVCLVAKAAWAKAPEKLSEIENGLKLGLEIQDVFEIVKNIKGYGPFLAYEVTLDLSYVYPEISCMNWANTGPGASRGLAYIFKGYQKKHEMELLKVLRHNLALGYELIGDKAFSKATMNMLLIESDTPGEIDLRMPESMMCEYQKYKKLKTGTGRSFGGTYKGII
jgi:hypothetical protein